MKKIRIGTTQMILTITLLALVCIPASGQAGRNFTPNELAQYNGKNGKPAFVAVNGVVYNVTSVPSWAGGRHFCPNALAGKDITWLWNMVPRSHQRPDFLQRFTVAGRLVAAEQPAPGFPATTPPAPPVSPVPTPAPQNAPQPTSPGGLSLLDILLLGLAIAEGITIAWLVARLKKK